MVGGISGQQVADDGGAGDVGVGESFGAYTLGDDAAVIDAVSSVNIAAGFHAGDPTVLRTTVRRAVARGIAIGAHWRGVPADEVRALAFFTLVLTIVSLIFANRSFSASVRAALGRSNVALTAVLVTVATILTATLLAPALVKLGVTPMAAHMFVMYNGMLSMITPPVAFAAYAAANIARTDGLAGLTRAYANSHCKGWFPAQI